MKKLIALCLVLILAAPALTTNAESSLQKELNKERLKQNFRCMDFSKSVKFAA